jgi:hypothetical protein
MIITAMIITVIIIYNIDNVIPKPIYCDFDKELKFYFGGIGFGLCFFNLFFS